MEILRVKRTLKLFGIGAGVLAAALALLLVLLMLGLFRQSVASIALWGAGSAAGYELVCEEFEGNILTTFTCGGFSAADEQGAFFRAQEIELGWRFLPIVLGRLNVDHLRIADAELSRAPVSEESADAAAFPDWPELAIALDDLSVQSFVVRMPGAPVVCLNGMGNVEIAEPVLQLDLQFARCAFEGAVTALFQLADGDINVDLQVVDDGDLASLILDWDGAGATNIRLIGAGPLRAFSGTLDASIEDGISAALDVISLTAGSDDANGIGITGAFTLDDVRVPDWAPAANGSIATQIYFPAQGALRVENGSFNWGNVELSFALLRSATGQLNGQFIADVGPYDGGVAFQSADLSLSLQGNDDTQSANGDYALTALCAEQICAGALGGALELTNQNSTLSFATQGVAQAFQIAAVVNEVLGEQTNYNLSGSYALDDALLDLAGLIQAAQADLTLASQLALDDGVAGSVSAQLDLDQNALIGGVIVPVAVNINAEIEEFVAGGAIAGTFGLASAPLDASGEFELSEDAMLNAVIETTRADAEHLSELTGTVFSASPNLRASVTGTTELPLISAAASLPGLDLGGFAITDATWMLDARRAGAAWTADTVLRSQSSAGAIVLDAGLVAPDEAPIQITIADSQISEALIVGNFTIPTGEASATGMIQIAGNVVSPLGQYFDRPAASEGGIELVLESRAGLPFLVSDVALSNVSMGEGLRGAALEGALEYDFSSQRAQTDLRLVDGANVLALNAMGDLGEEMSVTIATLEGNWSATPIRLVEPALLRQDALSTALSGAVFAIGDGRLEITGSRSAEGLESQIALTSIPVEPFMELQGYARAQGTINASLDARLTPTTSTSQIEFLLDDFALTDIAPGLEPAGLSMAGNWDGATLAINGELSGLDEGPATFSASLPVRRSGEGYAVAIEQNAPMAGTFTGSARAERLLALLPIAEHRLTGAISASLQLAGTPTEPFFTGQARLQDGTYESLELGTRLTELDFALDAGADGVFVVEANATDGGDGRFSATGRMSFDENAQPIGAAAFDIANAYLVQRDEFTARGSGEIALAFPEGETGSIAGMFTTSEVRVDLGQPLPPGVEQIEVTEINRPAELGVLVEAEPQEADFISEATLDLQLTMPNNVRVEGYGVNAEWQGDISVAGTVGMPIISGEIDLVRGFAEFLGREFNLDEGSVIPDTNAAGGARIDITGSHTQDELSVEVSISGPAASPEIEWSSVPNLPRDEIISRLYFGRSSPQLTAYEAIQLAQLSGALGGLGGNGGVLGFARRMAGLDVLRIEPPESGDLANPTVTVGKYVTERVYVGARRDADTSSSSVEIEVDITPNISAEVETGTDDSQAAGVNWHFDY